MPQAKTLKQNLKEAMKQGGFSLGKWQSNSPELVDDEEGDAIKAIADNAEPDVTKVLGVSWDSKNDNFVFQFDKESGESGRNSSSTRLRPSLYLRPSRLPLALLLTRQEVASAGDFRFSRMGFKAEADCQRQI